MTSVCNGVCTRYKFLKQRKSKKVYAEGGKRCSCCCIYLIWDGVRCPCCGTKLRHGSINPKLKIAVTRI